MVYSYKNGFLGYLEAQNSIAFSENEEDLRIIVMNSKHKIEQEGPHHVDTASLYKFAGTITLTFITTFECNMKCKYCYESSMVCNDDGVPGAFTCEMMLATYIGFMNKFPNAKFRITFFGGEPFVQFETIREFMISVEKYCSDNKKEKPTYGAITNGTLLCNDVCEMIVDHFQDLTISLDGVKTINDMYRIYKDGSGTFDSVHENILKLKRYNASNILSLTCEATLTSECFRAYSSEITKQNYELFKHLFSTVGLIPEVSDSFCLADYPAKLEMLVNDYMDLWIDDILSNRTPANIIVFNNLIAGFTSNKMDFCECAAGHTYYSITPDLTVYPCQVSVFSDNCIMGQINAVDSSLSMDHANISTYTDMRHNKLCLDCEYRSICSNYCKVSMKSATADKYPNMCLFSKVVMKVGILKLYELEQNGLIGQFISSFVSTCKKVK